MDFRKTWIDNGASRLRSRLFEQIGIAAMFALLGGFVLMSAPALAEPPPRCDQKPNGTEEQEPLKKCEEKLNDAQGELLDELDLLIDAVENTPGMNLSALSFTNAQTGEQSDLREHMAKMKRQHGRAKDSIAESENEDFEEAVAQGGKKKGKKCILEASEDVQAFPDDYLPPGTNDWRGGLDNAECDSFEAWDVEREKWVRFQERSQPNICVRVCEDEDLPGQGHIPPGQRVKKKDKMRGRHIDRRSESIDATQRAADAVLKARQDITAMNLMAEKIGPSYAFATVFPGCERPPDVPHIATWGTKVILTAVQGVAKIAARVAEGIKDGGEAGTQQDVAGFNASSANIPVIVAYHIAEGIADATEILIQAADLTNEGFEIFTADATYECVNSIRQKQAEMAGIVNGIDGKADELLVKAGNAETALENLKTLVLQNRRYIKNTRRLVLTPHGRRKRIPLYEAPPLPAE